MSYITIEDVSRVYPKKGGDFTALDHVSLTIERGEFICLLGPSGCGKSTILNMLSGILPVSGGDIYFDEDNVTKLPPEERGIGLVFQNYALYPHMTVLENICFPLEIKRVPKDERVARATKMAKLVHVDMLLNRKPKELSGGQQQRVAIARALVKEPRLLLLDEPLSNLDARLRLEMREEIRRIQLQTQVTTIFVTHDQEEALSMSDTIVVLSEGRIQQIGTPKHIYQRPANEFVSNFIGLSNFLNADVKDGVVDFGCGYRVPVKTLRADVAGPVDVAVRPEEFTIRPAGEPGIPATVRSSVFLGMSQHYFVTLKDGQEIEVVVPSDLSEIIPDGTEIALNIVPEKVNVFNKETRSTLIREGV